MKITTETKPIRPKEPEHGIRKIKVFPIWFPAIILGFSLFVACGSEKNATAIPEFKAPTYASQRVGDHEGLTRISMALKGTRPTLAEHRRIADDPNTLETIVDEYLSSPEFARILRDESAERLLINVSPDYYPGGFPALGPLSGEEVHAVNSSLIEAAPRLIEHVVMNDKPYSEVVTADYTITNAHTSAVWGIPYDADKGGWQKQQYQDGRPTAGVLSDGFVFTRHASTVTNHNRGRAQQMARAFICVDYANRIVDLTEPVDLSDDEAINNAAQKNPVCNSCHQTLDPLASLFASHYPLRLPEVETSYPLQQYAPEYKSFFRVDIAAYYGQKAETIADLGRLMSEDPRFASCATRRFYAQLMDLPAEEAPYDRVEYYTKRFVDADMNVKTLLKEIVLSDDFLARGAREDAGAEILGFRRARPHHLDATVFDLTGFEWTTDIDYDYGGKIGKVNLTTDFFFGYRVIGGGTDGYDIWTPARKATAPLIMLQKGLAERAAQVVVYEDFAKTSKDRRLLKNVESGDRDENKVRQQIAELHTRIIGKKITESSDEEVNNYFELFQSAATTSNEHAWTLVISTMLKDPSILYY